MKAVHAFALLSLASLAAADNPLIDSSRAFYASTKQTVLATLMKVPEDKLGYQPSKDVRSAGQLLAHIADTQFLFCGVVKTGKPISKGFEKSAVTKQQIMNALNEGFAYCETVYDGMTDAAAPETINLFGQTRTRLSILDFNIAHTFEHYGNLVTYMRMNGIVPPSSEPKK